MLTEKEAKILFEEPIDIDKIKGKYQKKVMIYLNKEQRWMMINIMIA
ncbi:hypothetical protein [Vibrio parahaemolyticus]|nr:hypothetical protein [Vibrio parahaemolyticus]EJG1182894.1 hypothetical protein [Vibrio parahaemolyticus]EJG1192066.1 hypothetical protein [Vibrio parahaemolyticus]